MGFLKFQFVDEYEKIERGPFGDLEKFSKKNQKMRFLNSVRLPKNVQVATLWNFLTFILLQLIEIIEGGLFGAIQKQKFSKKSHCAEKSEKHEDSQRGILSMFSRYVPVLFWTRF